jgi:hypothetical protein
VPIQSYKQASEMATSIRAEKAAWQVEGRNQRAIPKDYLHRRRQHDPRGSVHVGHAQYDL